MKRIFISLVILIFLLILFFSITGLISKFTGFLISDHIGFNQTCLKGKDITLYVNTNDNSNSLKEINAKEFLDDVSIINCFKNPNFCELRLITVYPSWVINNEIFPENLDKNDILLKTGC